MSYSSKWCCPCSTSATLRGLSIVNPLHPIPTLSLSLHCDPILQFHSLIATTNNELNRRRTTTTTTTTMISRNKQTLISCCSDSAATYTPSESAVNGAPPVMKKRRRYRKQYPGEKNGITEEMRFVAMRLRKRIDGDEDDDDYIDENDESISSLNNDDGTGETWQPSIEGFVKYLVDSKLVFDTVERIVDESDDVSYAYFRRTGLERSQGLSKDLEWFSQQDVVVPPPSNPGITYAKYLEELAEQSAPLFLSHFYNIYFSHIAGGQVIVKQVSEKLLKGRELEFYRWDGDTGELLKGVRDKLNMLGEHWSRDEKNKCLREATKTFRFLGQIVRLIIL